VTGVRPVRVVIADDHPMYRFGLIAALSGRDDVEIVGEAADGRELLAVTNQTEPDVVLTDLAMPGLDGAAATAAILAHHPNVAVLVLTMREDSQALFGALRAGARGYLLKGADRAEIIRGILTVACGHAVYGAAVARRISDFLTGRQPDHPSTVFPQLTEREREVLDLVAAGCGNHDIARQLAVAEKTVRNHVSAIIVKLGVRDRAAAVATARDAGLGTPRPASFSDIHGATQPNEMPRTPRENQRAEE
jgi:DNA-binding NarL/FixJ family response regulator